jgi:hypothetical protein
MATTMIPLTGHETIPELRAMGMSEATAHVARKRGYWCPNYCQREYPQLDGPGGFAGLYDPQGFVINLLAQTVRKAGAHLDPETFRDWTQDLLLECWRRRHAPHVVKFVPYYQAMVKGLVRQWLRRRAQQETLAGLRTVNAA